MRSNYSQLRSLRSSFGSLVDFLFHARLAGFLVGQESDISSLSTIYCSYTIHAYKLLGIYETKLVKVIALSMTFAVSLI